MGLIWMGVLGARRKKEINRGREWEWEFVLVVSFENRKHGKAAIGERSWAHEKAIAISQTHLLLYLSSSTFSLLNFLLVHSFWFGFFIILFKFYVEFLKILVCIWVCEILNPIVLIRMIGNQLFLLFREANFWFVNLFFGEYVLII